MFFALVGQRKRVRNGNTVRNPGALCKERMRKFHHARFKSTQLGQQWKRFIHAFPDENLP